MSLRNIFAIIAVISLVATVIYIVFYKGMVITVPLLCGLMVAAHMSGALWSFQGLKETKEKAAKLVEPVTDALDEAVDEFKKGRESSVEAVKTKSAERERSERTIVPPPPQS